MAKTKTSHIIFPSFLSSRSMFMVHGRKKFKRNHFKRPYVGDDHGFILGKHDDKGNKALEIEREGETSHDAGLLRFSHILYTKGAKDLLWDVCQDKSHVYRISQCFSSIIKSYIVEILKSHKKRCVHQWNSLIHNIAFYKNRYNEICFMEKPFEILDDSFLEKSQKDFKDLADLITFVKDNFGLPNFPEEIEDFITLLNNPKGKEFLILKHSALLTSLERSELVSTVIKKMGIPAFEEAIKAALVSHRSYCSCMQNEFLKDRLKRDTLINQNVFQKAGLPGSKSTTKGDTKRDKARLPGSKSKTKGDTKGNIGDTKVKNTFMQLLQIIRNLNEHAIIDFEGNIYSRCEVEWKIFNLFPFYTHLLCSTLIEEGFYSRLSRKGGKTA